MELDILVRQWIQEGVRYIGVVGQDAALIEDIIDELCVGDGVEPYFMLTAAHSPDEELDDAIALAQQISEEFGDEIRVIEL